MRVAFRIPLAGTENMSSSVGAVLATCRTAAMQRAALPGGPPRASQHGVGYVLGIAMVKDVKF